MGPFNDDDDDRRDSILRGLSGEVDDFAGSQLEDPDKPKDASSGVTVTISIEPKKAEAFEGKETPEEEGEEHDEIAHILGMCGGGCARS